MTHMKLMAVSIRVDVWEDRSERRDAIDQKIYELVGDLGFLPVLIPNSLSIAQEYFSRFKFDAVMLTGGNSLEDYGGDSPERDKVEIFLITMSRKNDIPIVAICRGMQSIAHYNRVKLISTPNHIARSHRVFGEVGELEVNSFHGWSLAEIPPNYRVIARSDDQTIEGMFSQQDRTIAIMWHPERNVDQKNWDRDVNLLKKYLNELS